MEKKIVIIDGAMGTALQDFNLSVEDFGGEHLEGCNENLVFTRPDIVEKVHEDYLEAGADIIETNTFGGTSIVLDEYQLGNKAYEINKCAAEIAKKATNKFSDRFVAGSIGPTTKSLTVTGGITFDELRHSYYEQAKGLFDGGVDLFFIETGQDTLNMKAALIAVKQIFAEKKEERPIFLSGSILEQGSMLAGQDIEAFFTSLRYSQPFAIGMNCAIGPKDMQSHLQQLNDISDLPVFIFPNAGLPNTEGHYDETPEVFTGHLLPYIENGLVNFVGGCCGTNPDHIRLLKKATEGKKPRKIYNNKNIFQVSGIDRVIPDEKQRPIFVGERTNVQGSRKFKELIRNGAYDNALSIAKQQVLTGAQIIDICLEDTEVSEKEAIKEFYSRVTKAIKAPIMIDSTDPDAIEEGLKFLQGKGIINSINLESGTERLDRVIPLVNKYGAAVVVGLIDEKGMAVDFEQKIKITDRLYNMLTQNYGLKDEDLIFDPLVFTVDNTDPTYQTSPQATLDTIKFIKEKYPKSKTILGISNISFGLPPAGREVLNSVYLYHATQAGLDLAIINPATIKRYNSLKEEEINLTNEILFNKTINAIQAFNNYYKNENIEEKTPAINLSPEDFIHRAIVLGDRDKAEETIDNLLKKYPALDIISNILMKAMDEVGDLFGNGKLIVTEVLQSAEVMKLAIDRVRPHVPQKDLGISKRIILATVKGDVHDIGKNLVKIILTSNGFEVIDLGIKVDSPAIIKAINEHKADALGLSGLLIKSARQMVITAENLSTNNITIPLLVGGAALTKKFTETKIREAYRGNVHYSKDAMTGLSLLKSIFPRTG
ncbi:MAG: homocysteine S-methyltransferase family protein [Candidatus Hodarchaeales archaeon]